MKVPKIAQIYWKLPKIAENGQKCAKTWKKTLRTDGQTDGQTDRTETYMFN